VSCVAAESLLVKGTYMWAARPWIETVNCGTHVMKWRRKATLRALIGVESVIDCWGCVAVPLDAMRRDPTMIRDA
jgi:hypothetical protein